MILPRSVEDSGAKDEWIGFLSNNQTQLDYHSMLMKCSMFPSPVKIQSGFLSKMHVASRAVPLTTNLCEMHSKHRPQVIALFSFQAGKKGKQG
eukprot:m.335150 g.335150  ORF g.335150 m.335150 type:complete len:93 (-) comp16076_c0_seq6:2961-3239(-)